MATIAAAGKSKWTPKRIGSAAVTTLQVLCAVHLFNSHIAEIRPCTGASMYPTLSHTGSFILHSPLVMRFPALFPSFTTESRSPRGGPRLPARGSLITATSPLSPSHQVLKRVVGLPGDLVCVDPTGERGEELKGKMIRVPEGAVWLAGDNASNSTDSRDYGAVPLGMVKGSVVARIWPNPTWLHPTMRKVDESAL